ncbi:MAG: T9SS type A sorting domain-containing protein [Tunicatimonas sp.]
MEKIPVAETLNAVKLYPNPVSAELQIALPTAEGVSRVRIEDLQGRLVLNGQLSNGQSLDVSRLSPGTYLVRTWHGNQWHFRKLIKR